MTQSPPSFDDLPTLSAPKTPFQLLLKAVLQKAGIETGQVRVDETEMVLVFPNVGVRNHAMHQLLEAELSFRLLGETYRGWEGTAARLKFPYSAEAKAA